MTIQAVLPLPARLPHDLPVDRYGNRLASTMGEWLSLTTDGARELPCACDVCAEPIRIEAELMGGE